MTLTVEPRFWGDVSLAQLHEMLGTEDRPVDDLYRVCQVLTAEADRLLAAATRHASSWAAVVALSNDPALVAAYRRAEQGRLRLVALAEALADMSARIDVLAEQFVQVRAEVARLYREAAEAQPPPMLGWLVSAAPQGDAALVARTEQARRLVREYDENTCEVLRRWAELVTPVEQLPTRPNAVPYRSWAVVGTVQDWSADHDGRGGGSSPAAAGSDDDTVPRSAAGAGFRRWNWTAPAAGPRLEVLAEPAGFGQPPTGAGAGAGAGAPPGAAGPGFGPTGSTTGGDRAAVRRREDRNRRPTPFDPEPGGCPPVIGL